MESEIKPQSGKNVAIIVLAILLFIAFILIILSIRGNIKYTDEGIAWSTNKNEPLNNKIEDDVEIELDKNGLLVTKLSNLVPKYFFESNNKIEAKDLTENDKLAMVFRLALTAGEFEYYNLCASLSADKPVKLDTEKTLCNIIKNEMSCESYKKLSNEEQENINSHSEGKAISKNIIDSIYKEIFGKNETYNQKYVRSDAACTNYYVYDEKTNSFVFFVNELDGCGGGCTDHSTISKEIIDAKIKGKVLTITEKITDTNELYEKDGKDLGVNERIITTKEFTRKTIFTTEDYITYKFESVEKIG